MNWTDIKCTVLCWLLAASAFGAEPDGYRQQPQRDTVAVLVSRIATLQRQAHGRRHGVGEEEIRLQFAGDNFSVAENGGFRYRAIFTKRGGKPMVIDKTVDFTGIASVYPLTTSADGIGALLIRYESGDTVSFFYRDSGIAGGELVGCVLDLVHHVNKANGINLDTLFSDWETDVIREHTYDSVSRFIAKHPDSFLTEFARMALRGKKQPKD